MSDAWRAFYIEPHIGNRYSAITPTHWGCDFNGWPVGTDIPSPCDGVVVASGYNIFYGWYVTWLCEHGLLCGRAHMKAKGLAKGATVSTGRSVGKLGNTGIYSKGPHTHAYTGSKYPWVSPRRDPLPHIVSRLANTAGGGGGVPITEGENDMLFLQIDEKAERKFTFDGHTAIPIPDQSGGQFEAIFGKPTVVSLGAFNRLVAQGSAHMANDKTPATVTLTPAQLEAIGAAVKVDLSSVVAAVLDAIKTLPESVLARFRVFWSTGK